MQNEEDSCVCACVCVCAREELPTQGWLTLAASIPVPFPLPAVKRYKYTSPPPPLTCDSGAEKQAGGASGVGSTFQSAITSSQATLTISSPPSPRPSVFSLLLLDSVSLFPSIVLLIFIHFLCLDTKVSLTESQFLVCSVSLLIPRVRVCG